MRILVIEDDGETARFIAQGLGEQGHRVDTANDGKAGLLLAATEDYDVAIVDRMLPQLDGLAVVETMRRTGRDMPVLFLSAKGRVADRVAGLKAGGDDYLVKPFAFSELAARVEVLGRRRPTAVAETDLRCGDLEMDLLAHKVSRAGQEIALQPREFRLLECLLRHRDQVVTRTMLLEQVWDYHFDPQTNVIDVHISRLRQKIDKDHAYPLIHTVRGAGYRLSDEGRRLSDEGRADPAA